MPTLFKKQAGLFASVIYGVCATQSINADDTEIFTGSTLGGDPVIMLMLDSSTSMYYSMYSGTSSETNDRDEFGDRVYNRSDRCGYDNVPCTYLRRHGRIFHTQDATQALLSSINPDVKMGISSYSVRQGKVINQAFALGEVIGSSVSNALTYTINQSGDDGWQSNPSVSGTMDTSKGSSPLVSEDVIAATGVNSISDSWTNSGGRNPTHSGNHAYIYYHTSSNSTQRFDLGGSGDEYIYLLDPSDNSVLGQDDDDGPGNDSRLTYSGLTQNAFYIVVAATYNSGSSTAYTLSLNDGSRGDLYSFAPSTTATVGATGLHFKNISIPADTVITSAEIVFTASESENNATSVNVRLDIAPTPAALSSGISTLDRTWHSTPVTTAFPSWTAESTYNVDVTSLIRSHIASANSWPGNGDAVFQISHSSGDSRMAYSYDGDSSKAPQLVITLASGSATKTVTSTVLNRNEDGEQTTGNNPVVTYKTSLPLANSSELVGVRFSNIELPNANVETVTVTDAYIEFYAGNSPASIGSVTIEAEDASLSTAYKSANQELSDRNFPDDTPDNGPTGRPVLATSVTWNPAAWVDGNVYRTPNLKDLIQPLIEKSGWGYSNSVGFILTGDGTGSAEARSWDYLESGTNPSNGESYGFEWDDYGKYAPRLVIEVTTSDPTDYLTHREQLINNTAERDWITDRGNDTPVVASYATTAQYMVGGYNVQMIDRSYSDPHSYNSASEVSVTLPTPVNQTAACASNHVVLLTDGNPYNDSNTRGRAVAGSSASGWNLADDVAEYLYDATMHSGEYSVKTHAVAFGKGVSDLAQLADVANHGGGEYVNAQNVGDVVDLFVNIAEEVNDSAATFTAPAASVNAFNRLTHLNQLYYSVYQPNAAPRWNGNIKKYKLIGGEITDRDGNAAVEDGFFKTGTSDFWSTTNGDGTDVLLGGSAAQLPAPASRNVYTCMQDSCKNGVPVSIDLTTLSANNLSNLGSLMLVSDNTLRDNIIEWFRGVDLRDENDDGDFTDTRHYMGDPLHSQPSIVTYGVSDADPDLVIYAATNEGLLHALDDTGTELWSFIPAELLDNLQTLYDGGVSAGTHPYGLDGQLTTYEATVSGVVKKFLIAGMRRGGQSYYTFDITDKNNPRLAFIISSSATIATGLSGGAQLTTDTHIPTLGQTWSEPVFTKIKINGVSKEVLIFAGGYDTSHDQNPSVRSTDSYGNNLYIVDAIDGSLIWESATASAGYVEDAMTYSMPATPRTLDLNFDGYVDQIYLSDTGGQLWRFDVFNTNTNVSQLVRGGIIGQFASGSGTSNTANHRRFYEKPDVALISSNHFSVNIGSGWRYSPLDTTIQDEFYHIEIPVYLASSPDTTHGYYRKLTRTDLYDATSNVLGTATGVTLANEQLDLAAEDGWFITLGSNGEKVLSAPTTTSNLVIFTTYIPSSDNSMCSTQEGSNRLYVLNAGDGTGGLGDLAIRYKELENTTIAPGAQVFYTQDPVEESTDPDVPTEDQDTQERMKTLCAGVECIILDDNTHAIPTFWYEQR